MTFPLELTARGHAPLESGEGRDGPEPAGQPLCLLRSQAPSPGPLVDVSLQEDAVGWEPSCVAPEAEAGLQVRVISVR